MEEYYLDNKESGNLNIHLVLSSWSGQRQQCEAKENEETIVVWFSFLYFEASQQGKMSNKAGRVVICTTKRH